MLDRDWPDRLRDAPLPAFAGWMDDHRASHLAWLAEEDRPVGMAWLVITHRVPGPEEWTRLSGGIQSVFVAPDFRNRGRVQP
jgi:GNAT superfamily N-acetyltransferase